MSTKGVTELNFGRQSVLSTNFGAENGQICEFVKQSTIFSRNLVTTLLNLLPPFPSF